MSLTAPNAGEVRERMDRVMDELESGEFNDMKYLEEEPNPDWVTAEEIYWNEKTRLLFTNAEVERLDRYRRRMPNVFFGAEKRYFGENWDTRFVNITVVVFSLVIGFVLSIARVRHMVNRN